MDCETRRTRRTRRSKGKIQGGNPWEGGREREDKEGGFVCPLEGGMEGRRVKEKGNKEHEDMREEEGRVREGKGTE